MIRCLCIDDGNRPPVIPVDKWVKKDDEYRITFFAFCTIGKQQGVSLYEKPLKGYGDYKYFRASRFAIHQDDWDAFLELVKDCTEMNDVEINDLINSHPELVPEKMEY